MSPIERALWQRVQRRAARLTPELAAALLETFAALRDQVSEAEMARMVAQGVVEELVIRLTAQAVLNAAFQPVKDRFRAGLVQAVRYAQRDLPRPPAGATLGVRFDFLNPRVITAVRTVETDIVTRLAEDVRATVRAVAEAGLKAGQNPRVVAKGMRQAIGLGPSQWQQIANFRDALEGKDGRSVTDYTLRDRRFDARVKRGELTPEQIDKMVAAYTKRRIAQNAEMNARTLAHDAQRVGQQQAWADAVAQGTVDGDRLVRTWVGVMDSRERPEHVAMEGETVPWDQPYSTGQHYAGEGDYGCRCIDRYHLRRVA